MTTPVVTPSKAKAWWALLIPMVGSLAPLIAQFAGVLPPPWGAILTGVGGVIALATGAKVHQTPYLPPGTVVVPAPTTPVNPDGTTYPNPWA